MSQGVNNIGENEALGQAAENILSLPGISNCQGKVLTRMHLIQRTGNLNIAVIIIKTAKGITAVWKHGPDFAPQAACAYDI
ncbi:MAG: hypothetical protein U5L96_08740 [Owenweeksia sp.]|nr:hypothetical protein [Owenweeksia sp.]